jgi:diamine N-acetyltransferase
VLVGKKIYLRPLERQDLDTLAKWRNIPSIRSCFFSPHLIVLSCQDEWYDKYTNRGDTSIFVICQRDTNQEIGVVGIDNIDHRNQSAEYGRMLIAESQYRGQGLADDATNALLKYAFEDLNLNRIYLRVYTDNDKAIALYERCKFIREGIEREAIYMGGRRRDLLLMSILRSEFKA